MFDNIVKIAHQNEAASASAKSKSNLLKGKAKPKSVSHAHAPSSTSSLNYKPKGSGRMELPAALRDQHAPPTDSDASSHIAKFGRTKSTVLAQEKRKIDYVLNDDKESVLKNGPRCIAYLYASPLVYRNQ